LLESVQKFQEDDFSMGSLWDFFLSAASYHFPGFGNLGLPNGSHDPRIRDHFTTENNKHEKTAGHHDF